MIDSLKALTWLNAIGGPSRLNGEVRRVVQETYRYRLDDARLSLLLARLRNMGQASRDPLEKAEVLLWCASIGSYRNTWSPPAARDAAEAVSLYDCDEHRRAVALWILGIIQWEMFKNREAYRNWCRAKDLFRQRQILFQYHPNERQWYQSRLWDMELELIAHPEEIACWLNHFEASCLQPPTRNLVDGILRKTRQQTYFNAYDVLQDLQEATRRSGGFYETAEIYLEFGLALYQLRNSHSAIQFLRNAVRSFFPGSGNYHKQVVARCMLGAVEWLVAATQRQAATDWIKCMDDFEDLRWCAERDRCPEKQEWYAQRRDILRAALLERVEPDNGSEQGPSYSGENFPRTSPCPNPGKTDPYQELLSRLQWDRELADRLIEYERKKAPAADRNELVRRALGRVVRDNQ